jgi:hypothetical protein
MFFFFFCPKTNPRTSGQHCMHFHVVPDRGLLQIFVSAVGSLSVCKGNLADSSWATTMLGFHRKSISLSPICFFARKIDRSRCSNAQPAPQEHLWACDGKRNSLPAKPSATCAFVWKFSNSGKCKMAASCTYIIAVCVGFAHVLGLRLTEMDRTTH